jgi:sensor histidine kinase YesM
VNATNTSGKWSPHIKKVILVITPPIWKTGWFIITTIAVAALLLFYIIYSRIKSISKKEKQQLQYEREVMELEAQALRSQMNPHFIFNCLNSIKLLIQEDKKQEAITYLTTFSKLIRSQLNNNLKEISLGEELKTCRLYVQMEALRFGSRIGFEFTVEEPADIYSLMIPPLIIQPFIENAIWHGIIPRETGGKVTVTIIDKGDQVQCIIDDNGIGREQSQQIKSESIAGHAPRGMQLTQNRMHLYNLMHQREGSIAITDKKDEHGKPCGTTVTISFKKEV